MTHVVKELVFHDGKVVYSGTKEDCQKYIKERDLGYAGDRPCFVMEPAAEETR